MITVSTAAKYDSAYLIVSHDGYIVTMLPLGPVLDAGGGTNSLRLLSSRGLGGELRLYRLIENMRRDALR